MTKEKLIKQINEEFEQLEKEYPIGTKKRARKISTKRDEILIKYMSELNKYHLRATPTGLEVHKKKESL